MTNTFTVVESRTGNSTFTTENRYYRVRLADGRLLNVGVERGSPTRAMYGKRGFKWLGFVRDEQGRTLFSERVDKSTGAMRILVHAGLVACDHRHARRPGDRCNTCGLWQHADGSWQREYERR